MLAKQLSMKRRGAKINLHHQSTVGHLDYTNLFWYMKEREKVHILYCLCLNFFPGHEAGLGTLAGLRASRAEMAWPSPCPVLELIQEKGLRDIAKAKGHGRVESRC